MWENNTTFFIETTVDYASSTVDTTVHNAQITENWTATLDYNLTVGGGEYKYDTIIYAIIGGLLVIILICVIVAVVKRKHSRRRQRAESTRYEGVVGGEATCAEEIRVSYVYREERETDCSGGDSTSLDDDDDDSYDEAASTDIFHIREAVKRVKFSDPEAETVVDSLTATRDAYEVPRNTIHITDTIFIGKFYQILKGRTLFIDGDGGYTDLAIKVPIDMGDSLYYGYSIRKEIELMKTMQPHDNIITFLGCCTEIDPPYLITEYSPYGNLKTFITDNIDTFAPTGSVEANKLMLSFATDIANGMSYLASLKIVYRYLAAKHVLVCHGRLCKISNLSYTNLVVDDAKVFNRVQRTDPPYQWLALETLTHRMFNTKTDIWSYGVVLWEMLTLGKDPYEGIDQTELVMKIKRGFRLTKPDNCGDEMYELMMSCWYKKPSLRPNFQGIRDKLKLFGDSVRERHSWCSIGSNET